MPEIHITLSLRFVVIFITAIISVIISIFVYRYTLPPIQFKTKVLLIFLRSSGLLLLFLLLGEPLISLITHISEPPSVAVLIDDSQSMGIKDFRGKRSDVLKSVLKSDEWKKLKDKGKILYALFDEKLHNVNELDEDSLTQKGESTDIAKALMECKEKYGTSNLQAVVLITDGISTVGVDPLYEAEELGVPVFTIGVGDTSEQKDLLIRKVISNEIAYLGTKVPVNVTIHSVGFGGERVLVSLKKGTKTIDEKAIYLETGSRDYLVSLVFIPEEEGLQKYFVEVSTLSAEHITQNNRMSFFVKVLKSKLRVTLIAGAPNQDVAFIKRILEGNKNIELKSFIERNNGQFYNKNLTKKDIDETDCIMTIGFPSTNTNLLNLQMVVDAVNEYKPIMVVLSRTMDYSKLRLLDSFLPFTIESVSQQIENNILVSIPDIQKSHPIVKVSENINSIEAWSKLPPVFRVQGNYRIKAGAEILVTARLQTISNNDPFIVLRNINKKKSVAVLGYGLWRWKMLSDAESGAGLVLENFLNNSVRWLTTQEDSRRVRVQPSKQFFTMQDEIEFVAQVYDENFQPIDNAVIEISSQRANEKNLLVLNSLGNGQYQGSYERLPQGDYKYVANVQIDGKSVGKDEGNFSVGGLNVEYIETRMNKPLLQQIAVHTGGKFYEANNINSFAEDILTLPNFKPQDLSKSKEIELWNSPWSILIIIVLFSLEWFIRKRNGML